MTAKVSLKYYLLTSRTTTGDLPVYLRITLQRKKAELHTGYTVKLKDWSQDQQMTKGNNIINKGLSNKKSRVYELISELESKNKPVSANILKEHLTGKAKINIGVLSYFNKHISEIEIRKEIKPVSVNKYKQSLSSLKKFILIYFSTNDFNLDGVDYDFINQYDLFLKTEYNLHKNTINKYHSRFRTLLLKALAEGHLTKQPYVNYKLTTVKTDREFLSSEELDQIVNLDISHNQSLDRVRDVFIFSVYTGLRFQDAQDLTTENLITYKNKPSIRFILQKGAKSIEIPLLAEANKIIHKYIGSTERMVLNRLLPKISNQKINAYLKIIADLAGLNRNLSHHIARHTFSTTICLNNNMPMEDLSKLLGHSSLKTTQIYGKITQERLFKSIQKINTNITNALKKVK